MSFISKMELQAIVSKQTQELHFVESNAPCIPLYSLNTGDDIGIYWTTTEAYFPTTVPFELF